MPPPPWELSVIAKPSISDGLHRKLLVYSEQSAGLGFAAAVLLQKKPPLADRVPEAVQVSPVGWTPSVSKTVPSGIWLSVATPPVSAPPPKIWLLPAG